MSIRLGTGFKVDDGFTPRRRRRRAPRRSPRPNRSPRLALLRSARIRALRCQSRPASREAACSAAVRSRRRWRTPRSPARGRLDGGEAARQHEPVLDALGRALAPKRQHRVGGVPEERHPAARPRLKRRPVEQRPLERSPRCLRSHPAPRDATPRTAPAPRRGRRAPTRIPRASRRSA